GAGQEERARSVHEDQRHWGDVEVTANGALQKHVRAMALAAGDRRTVFAYECFDHINHEYFGGILADPFFIWTITDWSGCLGLTERREVQVIRLHPALLGSGTERPWGVPNEDLGAAFAFDVIVHEVI